MPWNRWYCQLLWLWQDMSTSYSSVQKVCVAYTHTSTTSYKSSSKPVIHYLSINQSSSNNPKWGTVQRIKNIAGTCTCTHTRTIKPTSIVLYKYTCYMCMCSSKTWKLVRPKPDQLDCLLWPWISTIDTWENSAEMSIFKFGVTGNQCMKYTCSYWDVESSFVTWNPSGHQQM